MGAFRREGSSMAPADLPLTVAVEGDQLVIRIGVATLAFAFETGEENQPFDVTDRHRWALGVANGLQVEAEDGSTPLTNILDEAFTGAVESDMGVEEDGRLVTREMLDPDTTVRV